MAKISVSNGRFGKNFRDALNMAKLGDVLMIKEGQYVADSIFMSNLNIVGVGDPSKIIIHGQLEIRESCRISNVTISATPFHNALSLKSIGARLELDSCTIFGEATGKYPAIYCNGGKVLMNQSTVHYDKSTTGISFENNSELYATGSGIAGLKLVGSKAVLTDVHAFSITCSDRGRVESTGFLEMHPAERRRSLVMNNESVCNIQWLRALEEPREGLCLESYMKLEKVDVPEGQTYTVVKEGHGLVDTNSPVVTVDDRNERPEPSPAKAPEPKIVMWRQEDARDFDSAVAPQLNKGDTILLEEGEYFLEQYKHVLRIGVDIAGKGRADRTVINGTLVVMEGCDVNFSNLTLRPTHGNNALQMLQGNSAKLTNVTFEPAVATDLPVIYVSKGTLHLSECRVLASTESQIGRVEIHNGAHLEAVDSHLGWLGVWGNSSVKLSQCSSVQIRTHDGAEVNSVDGHYIEANSCSMRQLTAENGSAMWFDRITTNADEFEAYVEASSLTVGWLESPEEGPSCVLFKDNAQVEVGSNHIVLSDLDDPEEMSEQVQVLAQVPMDRTEEPSPAESEIESGLDDMDPTTSDDRAQSEMEPLDQLNALTGLSTVKEQIETFTRMVQFNQLRERQGLKSTGLTMHSLFLGNPGTGKTTVARLLGKSLFASGAIDEDKFVEVSRRDLVGEHLGASANLTHKVLESARGGVLFIDEAYSLYQKDNNSFGQEAVDTVLTYMENNRADIVVIFAGYSDRMQDFLGMNPGLKSRVPNRFDFEDYTPEEIALIGYESLLNDDYTVDEPLYRRVVARKYGQSSDKSNGRWVRNFNEDLVKVMARRVFSTSSTDPEDLTHITEEDVYNLGGGDLARKEQNVELLLDQLDALTGLANVKQWVRKLVNRVKVDQQRMELDGSVSRPTYHMAFVGNPGTGKTTVAKLIAQLFYNLGILETSTVKEVDRTQLIGRWIGHTEEITSKAIDEAMGGVLFVDEAYQLNVENSTNDFGKQAIETFMTRLENDRDKFVAIFAGYTENMDSFLGANPGLRSRIPLRIEFPDYLPGEIAKIVVKQLAQRWLFDETVVAGVVVQAYTALEPKDRSNGRWARNFVEQLETEQIEYLASHGVSGGALKRIPDEVVQSLLHV